MKDSMDIYTIMKMAIEREDESYVFYSDVAKRVQDQATRNTFLKLAKDELGHKDFIDKCVRDPNLLQNLPVPQNWKLSEATKDPVLSVEMTPKDAITLAMKKEQGTAEFYSTLAGGAVDSTYRETFKGLATMELGHKARLESIFMDMGFPEVW
ncbi:MAG: ferritin family protein [Dehalococcoidales bacterium]|nr:ferritin family protein [Dehalococcoidales bacterium]